MPTPTKPTAKRPSKPAAKPTAKPAAAPTAKPTADSAEPLLKLQTPHARALTQQLRALIKELVPKATETVQMGWEVILFGSGAKMSDSFASLAHRPTYVNLQFPDAVDLPDPKHRLEGTGKRMRHVKIYSEDEVRAPEIKALIKAAAKKRGL